VSLALLAAGGLFVRSAIEAASASPGFALERLLVFSLDPSLGAYDEGEPELSTATYLTKCGRFRVSSTPVWLPRSRSESLSRAAP
jgi:hypothetical protein